MLDLLGEALNGAIDRKLLNPTKAQVGINCRKTLYHLPLVPEVMNSCFLGSLSITAFGKMEVRLQKISRMSGKNRAEAYFLVIATVEDDEEFCRSAANVFESMAVTHGSKTDVTGAEFHNFRQAVGRKDSEADLA